MARKSVLLEYVIRSILNMEGVIKPTANYFTVALFQTLEKTSTRALPSEISYDDSVRVEISKAKDFLNEKYNLEYKTVYEGILNDMKSPGYDEIMDILLYNRVRHAFSSQPDDESVTVLDYLKRMLGDPTKEIEKHIASTKKDDEPFEDSIIVKPDEDEAEAEDEEKPEESTDDTFDSWLTIRSKKTTKTEPKKTGKEKLAETVDKTRDIQKILLSKIFGQDHAVNSFASGYFRSVLMSSTRKNDKKPQATFLFAGPPGVGKTFLAETAAETLGLPFMRFDMSEYADKEANIEFCGSDKVYKNGKEGNVTSFVAENPECVLLFDEIEKAHLVVIHLFLQILDAGRIRDNYTDEEVSFSRAIIIFTTNAGKGLYEDPSILNLSALPRKKILSALSKDMNPVTNAPLFPAAICSRFASGNVVMFNRLEANNLHAIAKREIDTNITGISRSTKIKITADEKLPTAIMLSEGGKADARTVKGRANAFVYDELYELFRMLNSKKLPIDNLNEIKINIKLDREKEDVVAMFEDSSEASVLIFADKKNESALKSKLKKVNCFFADTIQEAKEILFNNDITIILCDVFLNPYERDEDVLNVEDFASVGSEFLSYALSCYAIPVYVIEEKEGCISQEEELSLSAMGVRGFIATYKRGSTVEDQVIEKCKISYQQLKLLKLAKENKVVSFKTSQSVTHSGKIAAINLFDFSLSLATDTDDSKNILDNLSKPDVKFDDVIGASDAKRELSYFVNYLKNPIKFLRKGVHAPKGVLLYGPPGTGKTLLAKAVAGESDVTYLAAEGNEFLKRFVGEGPEAVHKLFNSARKYAPSIIFIDEIDAIAKSRASGSTSETAGDVLTAFLTEMDGFNTDTSRPVFVLAATNFEIEQTGPRSLDPALLRRFDRRILVDLPNKEERRQFLRMKLSKNPMVNLSEEEIDNIAIRSTGMSLAELDSVFEMAMRNAIRNEDSQIDDADFEEAFETFNSGEKKEWNEDSLTRTARHEAGHALALWLSGETPSYLTVVARGNHGGYMQRNDREGKGQYTKEELLNSIRTSLAGRAAEIVYYGETEGISTGASGDLQAATQTAEHMICNYGMDEKIGMSFVDKNDTATEYHGLIRKRVNEILEAELKKAIELISKNRMSIDALVSALIDKNHLKGNEIDEILKKYAK